MIGVLFKLLLPYVIAGGGYLLGYVLPQAAALQQTLGEQPIPTASILVLVIISVAWLFFEFFGVVSRETPTRVLQSDTIFSSVNAMVFSGIGGYQLGAMDGVMWLVFIPWVATIIDSFTASWFGINNATQKPFGLPGPASN